MKVHMSWRVSAMLAADEKTTKTATPIGSRLTITIFR